MNTSRVFLGRLLLVVLGLTAIPLIIAEVALQVGHGIVAVRRTDPPRPDPSQRLTVLCLGDSHTYGVYYPESCSYPARVRDYLGSALGEEVTVVRAAQPGLSTATLLAQTPRLLTRYRPDFVLILGGVNNRWNAADREPRGILDGLRTWKAVRIFLAQRRAERDSTVDDIDGGDGTLKFEHTRSVGEEQLAVEIERDYREIAGLCRAAGATPVFLTYAAPDAPLRTPNRAIRAAANPATLLIDLARDFAAELEQRPYDTLLIPGDYHPRPAGYDLMARAIADRLVERITGERQSIPEVPPVAPKHPVRLQSVDGARGLLELSGPAETDYRVYLSSSHEPPATGPRLILPLGADRLFLATRELPELAGRTDDRGRAQVRLDLARLPAELPARFELLAVAVLLRSPARPGEPDEQRWSTTSEAVVVLRRD